MRALFYPIIISFMIHGNLAFPSATTCATTCTPKTSSQVQLAIKTCELEMDIHSCQDFEPSEYRRTCCPEDVQLQLIDLLPAYHIYKTLKACHNGAIDATADFFEWIEKDIIDPIKKKNEWYKNCDLKCRRHLTSGDPYFDNMSDTQLEKLNPVTVEHIYNQRKSILQRNEQMQRAMNFDPIRDPRVLGSQELQDYDKRITDPDHQKHLMALYEIAKKTVEKEFNRSQCIKPEYYVDLICYGLFTIIDPTAAAGLVLKSPRLAKLLGKVKIKGSTDSVSRAKGHQLISLERELFIKKYLDRDYTTVSQREAWIKIAKEAKSNDGRLFFDSENSVLRMLNKQLNDKNLVTSLTNKHKELLDQSFKVIEKKWGAKVDFLPYSDYKSFRVALVPKPPLTKIPAEIEAELFEMYNKVNQDFTRYLMQNNIVRKSDLPEDWFRAAIGSTADEANYAARSSREMSGPNQMQNYADPRIQENLKVTHQWTEDFRENLETQFKNTPLFEKTPSGVSIPKEEVFEVLRKTDDPEKIRKIIIEKIGYGDSKLQKTLREKLDDTTIDRLQTYKIMVDNFSPSLRVAERKITSLEGAEFGGMSADFAGLGARNLRATAEAMAQSKSLDEVLVTARNGEIRVTKEFDSQMLRFENEVRKFTSKTVASGDDFVSPFSRPLSVDEKKSLLFAVAEKTADSQKRIAFIAPGAKQVDRNRLATHGEAIESELRVLLSKQVAPEKLKGLVFGVDMKGLNIGTGDVELLIGQNSSVKLSPNDLKNIRSSFKEAVSHFNQLHDPEVLVKNYKAK